MSLKLPLCFKGRRPRPEPDMETEEGPRRLPDDAALHHFAATGVAGGSGSGTRFEMAGIVRK